MSADSPSSPTLSTIPAISTIPDAPVESAPAYTNREVSWLDFNERVLELAEDETIPLLERAKFLAIFATNLDEFFMVRVAGVHDQIEAGIVDARRPDGLTPAETLNAVSQQAGALIRRHALRWEESVKPALAEQGIRIIDCAACSSDELETVDRVHLEPLAEHRRPAARSDDRGRGLRAREGADRGAAAFPPDRPRHVRPARGGDRPPPGLAFPRHGDPAFERVPRDA
jgi:hypothetical protein